MSLALMSNKPSLHKISTKELSAELDRRFKQKQKRILSTCKETCEKCKKTASLKEWSHVNSYWFVDDVYTQNYRLSDDIEIICPFCKTGHDAYKKKKYETIDTSIEEERYKRIAKFHGSSGKFKHYYQEYDGGYGQKKEYYESEQLYCATYEDKPKKVENPFK